MRSFVPVSIRARFTLIIIIAFSPVLIFTFFSYLREKRVLLAHINEDVMGITQVAAGTQEMAINSAFQLLGSLAAGISKDEQACPRLLARLRNENPVYQAIGFVSSNGARICTTSISTGIDFVSRMEENTDFAIDPWVEESGNRSGLIISHYFKFGALESKAALFVLLDMKRLYEFTGLHLPQDAEYILCTEKGIALAAGPEARTTYGRNSPLINTVLNRREGTTELEGLDGKMRLYAFKPLSSVADTGIYISVGLVTSIYSDMDNILALDLLVLSVSLMSSVFVWVLTDRTLIKKVNTLVGTAQKLSTGDMKARTGLKHEPRGEIERIAVALDRLAEKLESRTRQLDSYQEQLRSMASELLLTEERERHRIATEIHDRIGQTLAISKIKLGALIESSEDSPSGPQLADVRDYINQAILDTRSIIYKISSPILYELGLEAALEWLAEQFQKEHGITCLFRNDRLEKPMEEGVRTLLFQAANELLVNAVKHSRASMVGISCTRKQDYIHIRVDDNGDGFEPANIVEKEISAGFGLFSIRERLNYVKGTMDVISCPGKGTRITMTAPVKMTKDS